MLVLRSPRNDLPLTHWFSKCSVRSHRAPRENPMGSANYLFTFVFIFRNLLWGSINNGQPLHGLHNTKRLRTTALTCYFSMPYNHKQSFFVNLVYIFVMEANKHYLLASKLYCTNWVLLYAWLPFSCCIELS